MTDYTDYLKDHNDDFVLDENGNKIKYNVKYTTINEWYKHKEPIHVNDDGNLDTKNRHLIIKNGINNSHAITKSQLDTVKTQIESALATKTSQSDLITMQNTMTTQIQTSIQTALNNFKLELQKAIKETSRYVDV